MLDLILNVFFLFVGFVLGVWLDIKTKSRPKKPLVEKICFSREKNGKQDFVFMYFCPNCTTKVRADFKHCYECGCGLDWRNEE